MILEPGRCPFCWAELGEAETYSERAAQFRMHREGCEAARTGLGQRHAHLESARSAARQPGERYSVANWITGRGYANDANGRGWRPKRGEES